MHLTKLSITFLWIKAVIFFYKSSVRFEIWSLLFFLGLLWPQQPRMLDGKPQILMWKKGRNLVYLYEKLSILSIGGARLIFMNSSKCPTKSLIKKWDVVLSGSCAWRYSFSQLSIRTLKYLVCTSILSAGIQFCLIVLP